MNCMQMKMCHYLTLIRAYDSNTWNFHTINQVLVIDKRISKDGRKYSSKSNDYVKIVEFL